MLRSTNPTYFSQDNLKKTGLTNQLCMTTSLFSITTTTGNLLGKGIWLQPYNHKAEVFCLKLYLKAFSEHTPVTTLETQPLPKKVTLLLISYTSTNQKSKGRDPSEMKEVRAADKPLLLRLK